MSNLVVDSSVVAKWVLPEADSAKAQQLIMRTADAGERLIVLDLVFPEVANAIWGPGDILLFEPGLITQNIPHLRNLCITSSAVASPKEKAPR